LKKSERNTLKILELMQTNPSISIDELANSCNLTRDGINYYIKNLKKDGFIKRDGAKKNGYWEVLKTTL
ncbi:MAG: winged helix-turn-helix transcriptional regulator, partial [Bacteroidales bacterium]|nr:winged helix-turn-helix transcriptional regulator [Bacteroidales bacterium]